MRENAGKGVKCGKAGKGVKEDLVRFRKAFYREFSIYYYTVRFGNANPDINPHITPRHPPAMTPAHSAITE